MIRYIFCKLTNQPFEINDGSGMMDAGIDFVTIGPFVLLLVWIF